MEALGGQASERFEVSNEVRLVKVSGIHGKPRPINAALGRSSRQNVEQKSQPDDAREDLHAHSNVAIEQAGQVLT
jgi:hypothetical protein